MSTADPGLAERLVGWMAEHRASLDSLMAQEGSRAIHEEFIEAEGGVLPDRGTRIARARGASARAWMRHLAGAMSEEWPGAGPELSDRLTAWLNANRERLESLILEEQAILERRGASGDPHADLRDADLIAHGRLFAEGLATVAGLPDGDVRTPAELGREVGAWSRAHEPDRRRVEREARAAWSDQPPRTEMTAAEAVAPEPEEMRIEEAAAVWAHVRMTAEALEHALRAPPGTPAR